MKNHEMSHFYHAMLVTEYGMTFSFHFLPELNLSHLALWLGISSFALYTVIAVLHYRHATKENKGGNI